MTRADWLDRGFTPVRSPGDPDPHIDAMARPHFRLDPTSGEVKGWLTPESEAEAAGFKHNQIARRMPVEYDESWLLDAVDIAPFMEMQDQITKTLATLSCPHTISFTISNMSEDLIDIMIGRYPLCEHQIQARGQE